MFFNGTALVISRESACYDIKKTMRSVLLHLLGRTYRIESDYGIATVYSRFHYEPHTRRLIRSNQYWALLKWFNHWFGSDGWVGRYDLMGWQTFPSGVRFLIERFEPNELGAFILEARKSA